VEKLQQANQAREARPKAKLADELKVKEEREAKLFAEAEKLRKA